MVEVKRKKGETFEAFLRRYNKRMIQSGKVLQFKKIRYFKKDMNKNMQKKVALFRLGENEKREYLRKMGRLPEDNFKPKYKR